MSKSESLLHGILRGAGLLLPGVVALLLLVWGLQYEDQQLTQGRPIQEISTGTIAR